MSRANNAQLKSWVEVKPGSDFPIQNLPFGIFKRPGRGPSAGVAIGEYIFDLAAASGSGLFDELNFDKSVFTRKTLNDFIALGKNTTRAVRERISDLLNAENPELQQNGTTKNTVLVKQAEAEMLMPVHVPDYTDFYSSREHATNVGAMFRNPKNALLPNWLHLPVAYHGRASSIFVSGTPVHRPKGQTKADDAEKPAFGPSQRLDFELEMAFVVGGETKPGESISTANAEDYIFGLALFNDWSARDIQKWEYVPLGPFLGKNFGSVTSPWIVMLDALEPFRTNGPEQEPEVLPYLQFSGKKNYDLHLAVDIITPGGAVKTVTRTNFKHMYWNMCQQLAHHTVNGCNMQVGDLCASGTISGSTPDSYGSMLEITWGGKNPVSMPDGSQRKFILDNDTVVMRGYGEKDGVRIGFGECSSRILPTI